jgi:hypothetical protein
VDIIYIPSNTNKVSSLYNTGVDGSVQDLHYKLSEIDVYLQTLFQ